MGQPFSLYEYLTYLSGRWRLVALSCAIAAALAMAISLLIPAEYTGVTRIVIEPPAGNDVRAATAVSPIYLESLRTYEIFAGGDDIFWKAAQKFGLREGSAPIEKLKNRVLKVSLARNTKILEVEATLRDPRKAHALAQYIADETVKLSRTMNHQADLELMTDAERQLADAQSRLAEAQREWERVTTAEPVDALTGQIDTAQERVSKLQEELTMLELANADLQARGKTLSQAEAADAAGMRARAERLQARIGEVRGKIDRDARLLAQRTAHRQDVGTRRGDADAAVKAGQARLTNLRFNAGFQGERLRIVDPGIVPERPSSPRILLNVLCAMALALVAALAYASFAFGYRLERAGEREYTARLR